MKIEFYPHGAFHDNRRVWVYRGTQGRPIYLRTLYYDLDEGGWVVASGNRVVAAFRTRRMAKRAVRTDMRINETRRLRHGTVIRAHAWRDRLKLWPSERKIRHALKQPALRHAWRDLTYPLCFYADDVGERLGYKSVSQMWLWLAERGLMDRYRGDVVFAAKRSGRQRRRRCVTTDVIDFPDENSRFEFRMRWL